MKRFWLSHVIAQRKDAKSFSTLCNSVKSCLAKKHSLTWVLRRFLISTELKSRRGLLGSFSCQVRLRTVATCRIHRIDKGPAVGQVKNSGHLQDTQNKYRSNCRFRLRTVATCRINIIGTSPSVGHDKSVSDLDGSGFFRQSGLQKPGSVRIWL